MEDPKKNGPEVEPKTPEEVKLDEAREKYAEAYKAFLAERKENTGVTKNTWRSVFGSNVPESEITPELKKLEQEYDQMAIACGQSMYEDRKKQLEGDPTLSPDQKNDELKKFKQGEIFQRVIVQEHEELNKLKVENLPPKEKGVVRKSLEWYMGLKPAWKKVAISSLISTGAIVLFSSGAVVMSAGTIAGIAGGRIARASVGSAVGQGVSKAYDYFFKDHSAEEREAAEKELSEVFESNDALGMSFKETQENYSEILEQEKKEKRARLIKKAVVGLAAGAGTSYGMGQALGYHQQILESENEVKSSNAYMARNDADMVKMKADEAIKTQEIDLKKLHETDERLAEIHKKIEEKTFEPEAPTVKPIQIPNIEDTPAPEPAPIPKTELKLKPDIIPDAKITLKPTAEDLIKILEAKYPPLHEYDKPIETGTPQLKPDGIYKYDQTPNIKPEIIHTQIPDAQTLAELKAHPEFALNNPLKLSSQQLADTYNIHQQNIKYLSPAHTEENWRAIGHMKAKDLIKSGLLSKGEQMIPVISYAQKLEKITGLKPEGGFFSREETFEHYVARALQKAEQMDQLKDVTLSDTPVPQSPNFHQASQALQPETTHTTNLTGVNISGDATSSFEKLHDIPSGESARIGVLQMTKIDNRYNFINPTNGTTFSMMFNKIANEFNNQDRIAFDDGGKVMELSKAIPLKQTIYDNLPDKTSSLAQNLLKEIAKNKIESNILNEFK